MGSHVLVTGASSQLGVFLLPRLRAAEFRITAVSRHAAAAGDERSELLKWVRPASAPGAETVQFMVSCGPLRLASELAEQCVGLERVVAFSSTSILSKEGSANRVERQLAAKMAAEERALQTICRKRNVRLALFRPTLIYGCGLDRNISLLARFGRRFGFIPVAANATGLRQPVHADDLAGLAVKALTSAHGVDLLSPACGGSTISYREMIERLTSGLGQVRIMTLPPAAFAAVARLASVLPAFHGVNAEMVRRQAEDLAFDDSKLRELLDYAPRPFAPAASDFELPAAACRLPSG